MSNVISEFIRFLQDEKGLSKNTLDSYYRDIKQFLDYINEVNIDFKNVKKSTVLNYLYYLRKNKKSQATVSRHLSSIKSFYQFLFINKIIDEEPTYTIDTPKGYKKVPATLTVDQIDKLLSTDYENNAKGLRDKALIEVLYATGLRVSEVISLNLEDVNLNFGYVICKLHKERVIPIGSHALNAVKDYIDKGRKCDPDEKTLFLNLKGKKMTRQGCWKIVKEYTEKINPGFSVAPNTLRQSFAQHMLENGADLRSVQEMLGYQSDFNNSLISLISKSKIKEVYNKSHPRA